MKKSYGYLLVAASALGVSMFLNTDTVSAHGYVETPAARGYQGKKDISSLGWSGAFDLYGNVITNPQSLEAPKGFPQAGPADGRIASANGGSGQIGDFVLDNQSSNRWKKTDINTGANTFTWAYTAAHKTSQWHYYMTKTGWDQNAPLNRDELELIGVEKHDGSMSSTNLSHTIQVPENRMGYHVILAVWDVADTSNAFYNVIDVNVKNSGLPVLPTQPTNVKAANVTKESITLTWDAQTTAKEYAVYQNGKKVATVQSPEFTDKSLSADTKYVYEIEAVSPTGQVSKKSEALSVRTLSEEAEEKPTAPKGLHSMGETEHSVSLMWGKSTHSSGIRTYDIYRDGKKIGSTEKTSYLDTALVSGEQYNYHVVAVANDGSISEKSNVLTVSTKEETTPPTDGRVFKLGTFTQPETYTKGELVTYDGKSYETLVTHLNYGDSSWNPKEAHSLFKAN